MQCSQHKKGFTLVETLIAITVLLLVIIGPITTAQKGIQNAYYASEQLTAIFLAQEAIEAVRELRDEQALDAYGGGGSNTAQWPYRSPTLDSTCFGGQGCAYDVINKKFGSCSENNSCLLRTDTNGQYSHSLGSDSKFTRKLFVEERSFVSGFPYEWEITVDVSWESHIFSNSTQHVILQTWIYDHYDRYEN